jgi:ribose/xylose/arabinose/galactoside ABC-type transport system permease subunit
MRSGILRTIIFTLLDNLIWVLVLIALITFSLLSDRFAEPQNLIHIIPRVAAVGMLVMGQSFTMLTGHFDLSSESNIGLTAMVGGLLMAEEIFGGLGVMYPPGAAMAIMLLVGAGVGLLNGFMVTRLRMNNLVVTIAMLITVRGLIYIISPGSSASIFPVRFNWLGDGTLFTFTYQGDEIGFPVSIAFVLLCFAIAHLVTHYTQFGRNMYAVGANREAAEAAGIRSDNVVLWVYIISGLCAAVGGVLIAGRMDSVTPRTGAGWIFQVQAAAIIGGVSLMGGRGSMIGALGGVLLWGILDTGLSIMRADPFTIEVFRGGLLLFAMLLDAIKARYLNRVAVRESLAKTTIGLQDKTSYA